MDFKVGDIITYGKGHRTMIGEILSEGTRHHNHAIYNVSEIGWYNTGDVRYYRTPLRNAVGRKHARKINDSDLMLIQLSR